VLYARHALPCRAAGGIQVAKITKPQHKHKTGRLHLDRRAEKLAAENVDEDNADLLTTRQVAAWFSVSPEWLEIGRGKDYGPPFHRMGNNVIRYSRTECVAWLKTRRHRSTAEYISPENKTKPAGRTPRRAEAEA
jgi:hypothetical protein